MQNKLILKDSILSKIEEWCRQLPDKEWSGILFYKRIDPECDDIILEAVDFFVADVGTHTYTEFDRSVDELQYQVDNDLIDCYSGICHSHNSFATTFSDTDMSTLRERGALMPRFLSLIVNNAGTYTAKLTKRRVSESFESWGGVVCTNTVKSDVVIEDVEIIKVRDDDYAKYVSFRISEINTQKALNQKQYEEENSIFDECEEDTLFSNFPLPKDPSYPVFTKNNVFDELDIKYTAMVLTGNINTTITTKADIKTFYKVIDNNWFKAKDTEEGITYKIDAILTGVCDIPTVDAEQIYNIIVETGGLSTKIGTLIVNRLKEYYI